MSNFNRIYFHLNQKATNTISLLSIVRYSTKQLSINGQYPTKTINHLPRFTSSLTKHNLRNTIPSSNRKNVISSIQTSYNVLRKGSIRKVVSSSNRSTIENKNKITNNTKSDNKISNNYISRKKTMNQIPYHRYQPILKYIESIGLGIRPNQGKKYNRKKIKHIKKNDPNIHHRHGLSPQEEASFFAQQRRIRKAKIEKNENHSKLVKVWGKYKPSNNTNSTTSQYSNDSNDLSKTNTNKYNTHNDKKLLGNSCWWMPPPPFSPSSDVYFENDPTRLGYQIKRNPVRVLGTSSIEISDILDTSNDTSSTPESTIQNQIFHFPRSTKGLPEIAIAGRSNVGKSTLLNALLYGNQISGPDGHQPINRQFRRGRTPNSVKLPKGIKAIISDTPGETKEITFYQLTSEIIKPKNVENQNVIHKVQQEKQHSSQPSNAKMSLVLADLPGYGFAYAKEERMQEWRDMMKEYIINRGKSLKRVLLLLDARHGIKLADEHFILRLQQDLKKENMKISKDSNQKLKKKKQIRRDLPPIQIVLTKCDLVTQTDLARRVIQVREELSDLLIREPSALPVMLVSAKAGLGFNNIRNQKSLGGIIELQRELAALVPEPKIHS